MYKLLLNLFFLLLLISNELNGTGPNEDILTLSFDHRGARRVLDFADQYLSEAARKTPFPKSSTSNGKGVFNLGQSYDLQNVNASKKPQGQAQGLSEFQAGQKRGREEDFDDSPVQWKRRNVQEKVKKDKLFLSSQSSIRGIRVIRDIRPKGQSRKQASLPSERKGASRKFNAASRGAIKSSFTSRDSQLSFKKSLAFSPTLTKAILDATETQALKGIIDPIIKEEILTLAPLFRQVLKIQQMKIQHPKSPKITPHKVKRIVDCLNMRIAHAYRKFERKVYGRNRIVFQNDDLIDPFFQKSEDGQKKESGMTNLELMLRSRAPLGPDGQPINLHHTTQDDEDGQAPLLEVSQTTHGKYHGKLHAKPRSKEGMSVGDRKKFDAFRKWYWFKRGVTFLAKLKNSEERDHPLFKRALEEFRRIKRRISDKHSPEKAAVIRTFKGFI